MNALFWMRKWREGGGGGGVNFSEDIIFPLQKPATGV